MFRQSARSGLRPDQKPPELSPAMGNYSCRQRGSLPVITRLTLPKGCHPWNHAQPSAGWMPVFADGHQNSPAGDGPDTEAVLP